MAIEDAMVARVRPHMLAAKSHAIIQTEMTKGCVTDISQKPVALEPRYQAPWDFQNPQDADAQQFYIAEIPFSANDIVRLRLWVEPEQECDWTRSELFVKQFQALTHRIAFEIVGNEKGIVTDFLCHKDDELIVRAAFLGEFPQCELSVLDRHPFDSLIAGSWAAAAFRDYYPSPPYSHLFTRPNELQISPLEPLMNVLAQIPAPAFGVYQAVFQPVAPEHDWHRNVQTLVDHEYASKLFGSAQLQQRFAQETPSGDRHGMAMDVETKSHNDKPFFAAGIRIGVLRTDNGVAQRILRALSTFMHLFQHGGRPLGHLAENDYHANFPDDHIQNMFRLGATYRPGFLVNSSELAGFVHTPPVSTIRNKQLPVDILDSFWVPPDKLSTGTHIGVSTYAGSRRNISIPELLRFGHVHLIGRPGAGKSSMIELMCLDEIAKGHGVAILDPHGDLAERILHLLPEKYIDRVIYFEPGNPEWIPLWNPLKHQLDQDDSRIADEIVAAIKSISDGWGDRLGTLLQQAISGLLSVDDATLLDVAMVLKVGQNKERRKVILRAAISQLALEFWKHDIENYSKADFAPAQHKLNKLLSSDTVELMLSQCENRIDFRKIMDDGMIFIADLSRIGSESRNVLGKFILSFLHLAALSRSAFLPELRRPFHIYVDEAHRFVGGTVEDLIAETRKYKVSLTLAHQYFKQFSRESADALGVVGSTIAFNVQRTDAERLTKVFDGQVSADDLTSLQTREVIARIGSEVVRIEIPPRREISDTSVYNKIIELSRKRYCRPISEIRQEVQRRYSGVVRPVAPPPITVEGENEEPTYVEF